MRVKFVFLLLAFLTMLSFSVAQDEDSEFEGCGDGDDDESLRHVIDTQNDNIVAYGSDDDCFDVPLLGLGLPFHKKYRTNVYLCQNGLIKFGDNSFSNWPNVLCSQTRGQQTDLPTIAVFWTFANRNHFRVNGRSRMSYRLYNNRRNDVNAVFERATRYGNTLFGRDDFNAEWCMTVTWRNVEAPGSASASVPRNTFQVLLATDNIATIAVFIYGNIEWSIPSGVGNGVPAQLGVRPGCNPRCQLHRRRGLSVLNIDDESTELGERGVCGEILEPYEPTPEQKCFSWYTRNRFRRSWCGWRGCPRNAFIASISRDLRWEWPDVFPELARFRTCFLSIFRPAYRCCYWRFFFGTFITFPRRLAGSALYTNPLRWWIFNSATEQNQGFENCCVRSVGLCNLYFRVLRPCPVRRRRIFFFAVVIGDPHFITLDGKNYTFNGCGWYTYIKGEIPDNVNSSLVMQIRTSKIGTANATVITGFAIREKNSDTVQVNLNSTDGGGLILVANGEIVEQPEVGNTTFLSMGTIITRESTYLSISTPLGNGARIVVSANGTLLTLTASMTGEYKNNTHGLLGYWNGNITDDFTLPNGNILPIDLSDERIHYDFGEQWKVINNSETLYMEMPDDANYVCPENFTPVFLDAALGSLNDTLKAEAERICGNDVNCLYDIAATGNPAIGADTLSQEKAIENENTILDNSSPTFVESITEIALTFEETFNLTLTAEDEDGDQLSFDVDGAPAGAYYVPIGSNSIYFTWFVNSTEEFTLTFSVSDTKNGSSSFTPLIRICACQNNGTCFIPESSSNVTAELVQEFVDMNCNCPLGRIGRYCEQEKDFCEATEGTVCYPLVTCYNHPTSFECGPCPAGYNGTGSTCLDINECLMENGDCDQLCLNTGGSFLCSCRDGYTLGQDRKSCSDVDECSQPNDCAQLCNNTMGSYECYCRPGFMINPNDTKNCVAAVECSVQQSGNCAHICYIDPLNPGQEKCECNSGYILANDERSCEDVDECRQSDTNLCGQICTNTDGSYTCSCRDGYEPNGEHACSDIDECATGNNTCDGDGESCENYPGSYRCVCDQQLNFIQINGSCVFKYDDALSEDAPADEDATDAQKANAVQIRILNFQKINWTLTQDDIFRKSVAELVDDFCNANVYRPLDCGVRQSQLLFGIVHVQRVPGYPINNGSDAIIKFYIDYPSGIITTSGSTVLAKAILVSLMSTQLSTLEQETHLDLVLEDSVTLPEPDTPSTSEGNNSVTMEMMNFTVNEWTLFYDSVFTRTVLLALNNYCNKDEKTLEECGLMAGTQASFNQSHYGRIPGSPSQNGANTRISFYVNNVDTPILRRVLSSILISQRRQLEGLLNQQLTIVTSGAPDPPPEPSPEQTSNSVTLQVISFYIDEWTYLLDRRFRVAVAERILHFCNESSTSLTDCQMPSTQVLFTSVDVQRTAEFLTEHGNNAKMTFYVNYPGGSSPMMQNILASVVKEQLNAIQLLAGLTLILETSYSPDPPASQPTSEQSNNTVVLELLGIQADQWTVIKDDRLREAVASELQKFCNTSCTTCEVLSGQTTFSMADMIRLQESPMQDGQNAAYTVFVNTSNGRTSFPKNVLADVLEMGLAELQTTTSLQMTVRTSSAAEDGGGSDQSVSLAVPDSQLASQWSAIEDNKFRAAVVNALNTYCFKSNPTACQLTSNQTFMIDDVHREPNTPRQLNSSFSELGVFAEYPAGGTVGRTILELVLRSELDTIRDCANFSLTVISTPTPTTTPTQSITTHNPTTTSTPTLTPNPTTTITTPTQSSTEYQTTTDLMSTPSSTPTPALTSTENPAISPLSTVSPTPSPTSTTPATSTTTVPMPPQVHSSIDVTIANFSINQWTSAEQTSFERNLTAAIIQYCNQSDYHLQLCNMTREDLASFNETLIGLTEGYPKQDEDGSTQLSFYVTLPSGKGELPQSILAYILASNKDEILSHPATISGISDAMFDPRNLDAEVDLLISSKNKILSDDIEDIKETIAERMNQYCANKTSVAPCDNGSFSKDDVHVTSSQINGTDALLTFYVTNPGGNNAVNADALRNILSKSFADNPLSNKYGLSFSVSAKTAVLEREIKSTTDVGLIVGVSLAGALLLAFVVFGIVVCVAQGVRSPLEYHVPTYRDRFSVYTEPSSSAWEFDKDSPYVESPFSSMEGLPGFDEDGLPAYTQS